MSPTIRILNAQGEPAAEEPAPAGIAPTAEDLGLCGADEFRAAARVRKDQEVWLIEPGLAGGARVDGEPLAEAVPIARGLKLTLEGQEYLAELSSEAVAFRPMPSESERAAVAAQEEKRRGAGIT